MYGACIGQVHSQHEPGS